MARNKEATGFIIKVAVMLSVVCATLVSIAAVSLKPIQERNAAREKQLNILKAAGIYESGMNVEQVFNENFVSKAIDIRTGEVVEDVDVKTYDMLSAAKDPNQNIVLGDKDIAGIKTISEYAIIYYLMEGEQVEKVILPVNGYGLWGIMYGFIAIDKDGETIRGLTFYNHKETPGLGAEITNANWQASWVGKKAFDNQGQPAISLVKGGVSNQPERAQYQVDALAGATITSRGVENMVAFWLGENGYQPFLTQLTQ
ncbi:Na(+)-translocating NADH-quinone reductase subunit C [Ostreibacterium oceani]|uniref:Na(+)-translocating NADH-quinone reductase subunit C n=1 Tax=Ostreibacterium oceani TaxID=2654998 RepID=A0A6N7ET10_9GAMM|nr:Na(+)-translocating NADH-quinone reductase subunit C [Ostreibacterium oceani]MPV85974.1 Na(+)-translocating NADH-quinone reductase subunit C [Ostreibacterium oceani]